MNERALRRAACALSSTGVAVSGYLTYVHYVGLIPICGISQGCETVQTSPYAFLAGIPVALLGLLVYLILLASCISSGERGLIAGFGLSLVGFAFSAYLTYREVFTIHAICSWCVSSAVILTLLFLVNSARVLVRRPAAGTPSRAASAAAVAPFEAR